MWGLFFGIPGVLDSEHVGKPLALGDPFQRADLPKTGTSCRSSGQTLRMILVSISPMRLAQRSANDS